MSKQNREQNRSERAAAIRAAQARKERNRIALVVAIVVALGAIVAGGAWYTSSGSSDPGSTAVAEATAEEASLVVGKANAPVKVVIYEDFLCPYCRQLEDQTRDFLRESAAEGKVQVTYQPINLLQQYDYSARALNAWAAVLGNASPQDALKLHDLLFENQPYETASDSVSDADLAELVKEAGAGSSAVTAALKTKDAAFFAAAQQAMTTANVEGTPTVHVNGKALTGAVSSLVSQIEQAVQQG